MIYALVQNNTTRKLMEKNNTTAVEWLVNEIENHYIINNGRLDPTVVMGLKRQAKQMEKEKHDAWNAFLEREKTLGISDVKTIERIQWYYNQYYNETFGKQ